MGVTSTLAGFVSKVDFDDLPADVVLMAKRAILDTVGVTLAGTRTEAGTIIREYVRELGGSAQAALLGTPERSAAPLAALANGTFAHALDYDDVNADMRGHPSVPLLPAALAAAELVGAGGRDLIAAFVLGFEVQCRLGAGLGISHYERGWHATSTLGTIGAATAAGKLLGLSADQLAVAFGIATSYASGNRQNFGTMTKPLHAGHAAESGVTAALLAQRGFTADPAIFDAPLGFGSTFAPGRDWSPEAVVTGLGDPWEIVDPGIGVKKYPCCYATHRPLDATLALVREYKLTADQIDTIEVRCPQGMVMPLIYSRPQTGLEGKFSMEYCLAAAVLDQRFRLATFSDEAVRRPEAQAFFPRVRVVEEDAVLDGPISGYATVTMQLRDGRTVSRHVERPRGEPPDLLSWDELREKFIDCAAQALAPAAVDRAADLIADLEQVERVSDLITVLTAASQA
jgi:2-methylcitrate dehydratase PrpD